MLFYCSNISSKMFYGRTGAEFLRISRVTSKIEHLSRNCKQLYSRILKENGQKSTIKFSLAKMIQRHQEVFIKYNESINDKNATNRFLNTIKKSKSKRFLYIQFLDILHIFILFVFYILFHNLKSIFFASTSIFILITYVCWI